MIKKSMQLVALVLLLFPAWVSGVEYKATLAQMPIYAISEEEGVLVDLVRAIEEITGQKIVIRVYPFSRSMDNVIMARADFHLPLIKNNVFSDDQLPYLYSTETIFHVNFVLYSLKKNNISVDNLGQYLVETDRAHVNYFPFEMAASSAIPQSLKKINAGRIDGYIFADTATDPVLRELGFTNIQRQLYKRFDVKIILPKTEHGQQLDLMLTEAIQQLKASGRFQEIMDPVDLPFVAWQP